MCIHSFEIQSNFTIIRTKAEVHSDSEYFFALGDHEGQKEFFELCRNKTKHNCNCFLSTVSTFVLAVLLIIPHHIESFLLLTNSVRKFFHSRVEMNPKNDVIKFQRYEECNFFGNSSRLLGE
jgi:hypothetical protein